MSTWHAPTALEHWRESAKLKQGRETFLSKILKPQGIGLSVMEMYVQIYILGALINVSTYNQ